PALYFPSLLPRPPTPPPFPYTTLFRSDAAIAAVTQLYREYFPPGGAIVDLMSSWVSHLPADVSYRNVVGLGMNRDELAANPRLRSEEHTSELQSLTNLVCRLLLEKKKR